MADDLWSFFGSFDKKSLFNWITGVYLPLPIDHCSFEWFFTFKPGHPNKCLYWNCSFNRRWKTVFFHSRKRIIRTLSKNLKLSRNRRRKSPRKIDIFRAKAFKPVKERKKSLSNNKDFITWEQRWLGYWIFWDARIYSD